MQYGEVFDDYSPDNTMFYLAISRFYDNPKMALLKKESGFAMYVCKLRCLLNENRYLFAITRDSDTKKIGDIINIENLEWQALHIKQVSELIQVPLKDHECAPKRIPYLDHQIEKINSTDDESFYKCPYHKLLKIKLIHEEDNPKEQYQNKGNLLEALETYMTVLSFDV